ncbi:MAG: DUF853 family protein [Syntrophorhabdaceae bacterium]|nr:DUF853 family protein [Syntrophorhabdaceae bacterium]
MAVIRTSTEDGSLYTTLTTPWTILSRWKVIKLKKASLAMNENGISYTVGTLNNCRVAWVPNACPNPHLCISGATGTGKTHMLREIVETFSRQGVTFTIIDKHGDIDTPGVIEHRVGYGAQKGINPLAINKDPDYGGPKAGAQSFLGLLRELSSIHKMGPVQENMLFNAIVELYRANRILQEDPASWSKNTYPDLGDLERFLYHKYKRLLIGGGNNGTMDKEMDVLNGLYREKKRLERLEKAGADRNGQKIDESIEKLTTKYREYLKKGLLNDSDFMTYSDPKGLIGLKNRVQQINNVGVFIKNEFSLRNARINIKYIEDEQKKIVTCYILKRLVENFQKAGYAKAVRHYVIIDECSFFLDIAKIEQQITKITQECRKFGLGIILSTQNPTRFSENILLNTATKVVFMVEPVLYKGVSRTYGMDETWLKSLEPRKSCMLSTRTVAKGAFYRVHR